MFTMVIEILEKHNISLPYFKILCISLESLELNMFYSSTAGVEISKNRNNMFLSLGVIRQYSVILSNVVTESCESP